MQESSRESYLRSSSRPLFGAVIALAMLLLYETMVLMQPSYDVQVRNAPEAWFRSVLYFFGLSYNAATLVILGGLLVSILYYFSRGGADLKIRYFVLVLLESAFWGMATGVLLQWIMRAILLAAGGIEGGFIKNFGLAIGAGLFEEFFFRVVITGGLIVLFRRMGMKKWINVMLAVLIASFLFSVSHYIGSLGDSLELYSFLFRFFAGIWFTVLFVARGFAVVCLSHAFYDLYVLLL